MKIIGDGGHAKVIRELLTQYEIGWFSYKDAVIAVGDNAARKKEAEKNADLRFPPLISKEAYLSKDTFVGEGTVIMPGAIIAPGANVGRFCIVNHNAVVDHDCVIGDYVHIAPGAHLCGHVEVGEGTLVGVGVGIAPMCKIPAWVLVKARKLEMEPLYAE